jgi:hypothetical protein
MGLAAMALSPWDLLAFAVADRRARYRRLLAHADDLDSHRSATRDAITRDGASARLPHGSTPPCRQSRHCSRCPGCSAGKTSSAEYQTTMPIASRAAKTGAPLVTQPSSLFGTDKSDQAPGANPHRSTPASVRTSPAVSSLEAFRTPASVHPLTPVTGRRPKTLNDSGRSRDAVEPPGSTHSGRAALYRSEFCTVS